MKCLKAVVAGFFKYAILSFSRGWGFCLDDIPQKEVLKSPVIAPGVIYDVHHQCQLQYGSNATFCEDVDVSALCFFSFS